MGLGRGEGVGDGEPVWVVSATDWGRTEAPHGGVRHGTTAASGARTYRGEKGGKGALRASYLAGVLRRRLEAEDRGSGVELRWRKAAERLSGRAAERRR
jgi:hypothetical protein